MTDPIMPMTAAQFIRVDTESCTDSRVRSRRSGNWSPRTAIRRRSSECDSHGAIRHLERARALYRGDYLDDCPFYGDSAEVEERRGLLRRRCVDVLLALGERYEQRGDRPAAAAAFRQARSICGEDLPSADAALVRLGVPV